MDETNLKTDETKETVEGNEGTGTTGTQTVDNKKDEGNSKGTEQENQEETLEEKAQKLADGMLKKKMKNMPSKEELKAFKEWKESQKTDEEKKAEKDAEYETLKQENKMLKNEKVILQSGVDPEYVDFINFTLSKMDGDFEENLGDFLKEHPKYTKQKEQDNENLSSNGTSVKKNVETKTNGVKAILKQKHPELYQD